MSGWRTHQRAITTTLGLAAFVFLALSVAHGRTRMTATVGQRWAIDRIAMQYRVRHAIIADDPLRLRLGHIVSVLSPIYLLVISGCMVALDTVRRRLGRAASFGTVFVVPLAVRYAVKPLVDRRVPSPVGTSLTFPSGHLAILGAFLTAVFLATRGAPATLRALAAVALALAALAISALYALTGNHFATDCIGGLLFGACATAIAEAACSRRLGRGRSGSGR